MMVSMEIRTLDRKRAPRRQGAHWVLALIVGLCSQGLANSPANAQEEAAGEQIEAPAGGQPSVVAQFTTGVENREPVDQITFVESGVEKIFFFSDLRGLAGRTVQHRWIYGGEIVAEVNFEVRGPRWRVWSSKELLPDWIGDWTVEIVTLNAADNADNAGDDGDGDGSEDNDGEVIAAETFTYSAPDA